jgi:hypothetical protein
MYNQTLFVSESKVSGLQARVVFKFEERRYTEVQTLLIKHVEIGESA